MIKVLINDKEIEKGRGGIMVYEWSSDLETGNKFIDAQHKALFAAADDLAVAIRSGKGREEIEKTLAFLMDYSDRHFHDEEELQKLYGFPDQVRHRWYHLDFKKKVGVLVGRFQAEGPTDELLLEIYTSIGDWLLHHIKSDDFVLAAYLRAAQ